MKTKKFQKTFTVDGTKVTLKNGCSDQYLQLHLNGAMVGHVEVLDNFKKFVFDHKVFDAVDKAGKFIAAQFANKKVHSNWKPVGNLVSITIDDIDEDGVALQKELSKIAQAGARVQDIFTSGFDSTNYTVIRVETAQSEDAFFNKLEAMTKVKSGWGRAA